jgi:hypothetical protein
MLTVISVPGFIAAKGAFWRVRRELLVTLRAIFHHVHK